MAEKEPQAEQIATPNDTSMPFEATPWAEIRDRLATGGHTWLTSVRPDGRAHVVPVGALWIDGAYIVTTGQDTVKGNNLDHNPRCIIALSTPGFDVVVEGDAAQVHDVKELERIAKVYADQGWPAYVHDGIFDAPYSAATTGPGPYDVYAITPDVVLAFATGNGEEGGDDDDGKQHISRSTRYRF